MSVPKRKEWLDMGRGISILLVILFHSENTVGIDGFHWSALAAPFRMPLFFFISGYLFTSDRFGFSLPYKLSQILRGIVLPYFIFTSVLMIPKVFYHGMSVEDGLKEIILGWASWFVVALCGTQILFGLFIHATKRWIHISISVAVLFFSGIILHEFYPHRLPFYVNYSLLISPFFLTGIVYRCFEDKLAWAIQLKWRYLICLFTLYLGVIWIDINYMHTDLSFFDDRIISYRNVWLSMLYSMLGIWLMVIFLKKVRGIPVIMFIGRNSLIFYYLNGGVLKVCHLLLDKTGIINPNVFPQYMFVIILLIISTCIMYGLSAIIRIHMPLLVGDKQSFRSLACNIVRKQNMKIDSDESRTLNLIRVGMILLVVMIHVPVTFQVNSFDYFLKLVPHGICHIAVPVFFVISGYLFFPVRFDRATMMRKYTSRIRTLLVPYLFWNSAVFLLIVFPNIKSFHDITFANFMMIFWDTSSSFLHTPGTSPIDYPLWYLRDLFLCIMIFPIIYYALKYLSWLAPLGLLLLWISGIDSHFYSLISFSFFTLGCWLRCNKVYLFDLKRLTIWLIAGFAVAISLSVAYPEILLKKVGLVCGVLATFPVFSYLRNRYPAICRKTVKKINPNVVYFIYCSHAIVIAYFGRKIFQLLTMIIPIDNFMAGLIYFTMTFLSTILVLIIVYYLLNNFCPRLLNVMIGRREKFRA